MARATERFLRLYLDRWLDDERIRGAGDDGQREGGLTLEQETVYFRLCLTQMRTDDGYLPNRRALLCDAAACPIGSYEALIVPVVKTFFKSTRDGKKLYNLRVRAEWEQAYSKSAQARAASEVRWRETKERLSLLNTSGDPVGDASGDTSVASERERENKRETENLPVEAGGRASVTPTEPATPADLRARLRSALGRFAERTGKAPLALLHEHSRTPDGSVIRTLARIDSVSDAWVTATLDHVEDALSRSNEQTATEGTDETKAFWDRHPNAVADCVSYIAQHGNLEPAVAADLWLQGAGAPFHARIDVRRAALLRVKPP